MKRNIKLFALFFIIVTLTQSFHCGSSYRNSCSNTIIDTSLIVFNIPNTAPTFKLNDTVWLSSIINDTFYNRTKSDYVVSETNQYISYIQPYRIVSNGTNYSVNYANIEFNPVIADGSFNTNYSYGYNYTYRRNKPYNYLKVGFVAGKTGLFAFTININYYSDYNTTVYSSTDYCKRFFTIQTINNNQQNLQYWDSLNVSSLLLGNSSASIIEKNKKNYFFIKIVP